MEEGKPISRFTVNVLLHSRLIMLVICFSEHLLHLLLYTRYMVKSIKCFQVMTMCLVLVKKENNSH